MWELSHHRMSGSTKKYLDNIHPQAVGGGGRSSRLGIDFGESGSHSNMQSRVSGTVSMRLAN